MTDTLDKLKKAFQQAISTATGTQPWNEPLTRRDTVQSGQVFSAPVVQGGLGSWVASSGFPYTGTTPSGVQLGVQPPARNSFEMSLGLPGVPDVDFVPYNWNTNRFGGKGPALLGHPISWEIVGPTLKSPFCDWQWYVDTTANTLDLEAGPNPLLPILPTVANAYNIDPSFDDVGGLYVLFTFTGEDFTGSLAAPHTTPIFPMFKNSAPYELFRVESIVDQQIILRGEKLLSQYFGVPGGCRAITLIRPKVTRLAALPAPTVGGVPTNRTFVFVPPETSATSEYMPPYNAGAGSWLGGSFDVYGTNPTCAGIDYGCAAVLPVPKPILELPANLLTAPLGVDDGNHWGLDFGATTPPQTGVVKVYSLENDPANPVIGGEAAVYGYFEIQKPAGNVLYLRRVPEVNPDTGAVFYGAGPYEATGTASVRVQFFESISTLFSDTALNLNKLAAARLQNLIDPRTAGPSVAYRDLTGTNQVPAFKPDRAIFDTRTGANPGNLLDLGFRTVLFPAKLDGGGNCVPDFDKPLDSNELVLDPAIQDRQYIEIDYSAGVAYLSHDPGVGGDVIPDLGTLTAPNNLRKEIVLYAACVPYSMEDGQAEGGFRLTASNPISALAGFGDNDQADVFGQRIFTQPTIAQTLDPSSPFPANSLQVALTSLEKIPPSGFFFLVDSPGGVLGNRRGPYYYQSTSLAGNVALLGISGPMPATPVDPAPLVNTVVVLQRALKSFYPLKASSDTVRGSSKRISTLSFKNAAVSFGADGSVTLDIAAAAAPQSLQIAYEGGSSINVTNADGTVQLSNSTDTQNVLGVYRNFAGAGTGIELNMFAGTTGTGLAIIDSSTSAAARGASVRFSDVAAAGVGLEIRGPGAGASAFRGQTIDTVGSAGRALEILHQDGGGILVFQEGTGVGLTISRNPAGVGNALEVLAAGLPQKVCSISPLGVIQVSNGGVVPNTNTISNSSIIIADGLPGTDQSTLSATGLVVTDGAGVPKTATVSAASIVLDNGVGGSATTSALSLIVDDGINSSTVTSTSVTSDGFLYPTLPSLPSRTVAISYMPEAVAYSSGWARGPGADSNVHYMISTVAGSTTLVSLNQYLRTGMILTNVNARFRCAAVGLQLRLYRVWSTMTIVGPQVPVLLASATYASPPVPTFFGTLSLAAGLGAGHTVDRANWDYYLYFQASVAPGDEVHAVNIVFNDLGPRNY